MTNSLTLNGLTVEQIAKINEVLEPVLKSFAPAKKTATVLKSFRTQQGAQDWMKVQTALGKLPENVLIIKSFEGYEMASMPVPAPVHVIEESMAPVAAVVSVKDSDEMFKVMFKKGLIEVSGGMISLSPKFYELLNQFASNVISDSLLMKSVDDNGKELETVINEVVEIQKGANSSVPADGVGSEARASGDSSTPAGTALSEDETNNEGTSNTSVPEDGVGDSSRPASETTADKSPKLALSQGESDNKDGGNTAISDAEAKHYFKSFESGKQWVKNNPEFELTALGFAEKKTKGQKFGYVAVKKAAKINVGNRR